MKRFITLILVFVATLSLAGCDKQETFPLFFNKEAKNNEINNPEQNQAINLIPPRLIAHAGGDIFGIALSNSIDAFDASYNEGFRWIEVDIGYTSDQVPVCVHDWGNANWLRCNTRSHAVPTLQEFRGLNGIIDIEMATLDKLEEWLNNHADAYIVSDVKDNNVEFLTHVKENHKILFHRLIPQIYSFGEYELAYELGYENMILTLYKIDVDDAEIIEFCSNHKFVAVTINQEQAMGKLPKMLSDINIPVYAHTINNFAEYRTLRDNDIYGVYTDYFEPNNWIE